MYNSLKFFHLRLYLIFLLVPNFFLSQTNIDEQEIVTVEREFRGAWIATVANINWPSKPGLSIEQQKNEAIFLLDLLKRSNYNAVIFQVRPQADALYKSDLEPWSYFLTGQQGIVPDSFYDPLKFWIEEAHKRCLELHAWINPYRAHHKDGSVVSDYSIVKTKPELVVELKQGYWWFDPSLEETQDHLYTVVMDIARRYDIDGIHFDDYFYPYPSYNNNEEFPDSNSWKKYKADGGNLDRGDWRREHVNHFIERIYRNLKLMKPHVKFGLSPFGIWRPNFPSSIRGFDQYNSLYADAKLWLNKGWLDYWSPQLYWTISDIEQSFPVLLNWWESQNYKSRYIWTGLNIFHGVEETLNQIMITRGIISENPGNIHWSIEPLISDSLMSRQLLNGPYKKPVLTPPLTWLSRDIPKPPKVNIDSTSNELSINLDSNDLGKLRNWIIYYNYGGKWEYLIRSITNSSYTLPINITSHNSNSDESLNSGLKDGKEVKLKQIGISVVDKFGNESSIIRIDI